MKLLGFLFGGLMLLDGSISAYQPRTGFRIWNDYLRNYFSPGLDEVMQDYAKLPDRSIRFVAYCEIAMAALMLWLAGKARS